MPTKKKKARKPGSRARRGKGAKTERRRVGLSGSEGLSQEDTVIDTGLGAGL